METVQEDAAEGESSSKAESPKKRPADNDTDKTRTPNAYLVYCQQRRKPLQEQYPTSHNMHITSLLGAEWRELPEEKKFPFRKEAERLKEEFKLQFPNKIYLRNKRKKRSLSKKEDKHLMTTQESSRLKVSATPKPSHEEAVGHNLWSQQTDGHSHDAPSCGPPSNTTSHTSPPETPVQHPWDPSLSAIFRTSYHEPLVGPSYHEPSVGPSYHESLVGPSYHESLLCPSYHESLLGPSYHESFVGPSMHCSPSPYGYVSYETPLSHSQQRFSHYNQVVSVDPSVALPGQSGRTNVCHTSDRSNIRKPQRAQPHEQFQNTATHTPFPAFPDPPPPPGPPSHFHTNNHPHNNTRVILLSSGASIFPPYNTNNNTNTNNRNNTHEPHELLRCDAQTVARPGQSCLVPEQMASTFTAPTYIPTAPLVPYQSPTVCDRPSPGLFYTNPTCEKENVNPPANMTCVNGVFRSLQSPGVVVRSWPRTDELLIPFVSRTFFSLPVSALSSPTPLVRIGEPLPPIMRPKTKSSR